MDHNNLYLDILTENNLENLNENHREIIVLKLWELLGKVTERYTMGDSSSVPEEVVEELLRSICFLLKRELGDLKTSVVLLENGDLEKILKFAWVNIEKDIAKEKKLLEAVIDSSIGVDNISYIDTIAEIGKGLKYYNYRFFAHQVNCSIDYQLSNALPENLQGIEYINEYLKRLLFENKFCSNFKKEDIIEVLKSYCSNYEELLINIFEPVLTNAIGLTLLNKDIYDLEISNIQAKVLLENFRGNNSDDLKAKIEKAVDHICLKLSIKDDFEIKYVKNTALNLVPRIEAAVSNNDLQNIFLSFRSQKEEIKDVFIDNKSMDDEKLRDLIDEIRTCSFIKDKIKIIHNEVNSLADLVEILNNCIWQDEVEELINNISEEEIMLLKYYLDNKGNDNPSNTGWENKFKELLDK